MLLISYYIVNGDIVDIEADVIVNASNGVGFMGGFIGKYIKLPGVAESIHYKTKIIEKEAKKKSRKNKYIPSIFSPHKKGEIFVTGAGNLKAKHIIHAVTMKYPGMKTDLKTIEKLLPKIMIQAEKLGAKSIAIPLLGAGVGGIKEDEVLKLFDKFFKEIKNF